MSLISFTPLQDGVTGVNAAATNNPLNTIFNDYNGNITNANIASNAAIAGSKISYISVSNPVKFYVYRNTAWTSANTETLVQFDTKVFDTGTNVDIVTNKGRFTAPVAGFYLFTSTLQESTGTGVPMYPILYKNGVQALQGSIQQTGIANVSTNVNGMLQLSAADYVEVYYSGGGGSTMSTGAVKVYFQGFLISAT